MNMPVIVEERPKRPSSIVPPPIWPGSGGGDGGSGDSGSSFPIGRAQLGLWVLLTGIIMLFAGLTSAYIVLRGAPDWVSIDIPPLLWGNTVALLASSISIEFARRSLKKNLLSAMNQWLVVSAILGFAFLVGQVVAWRQLVNAGVYLQSTLHSSFLWVLTGVHAFHLIGGMAGLIFVIGKAQSGGLTASSSQPLTLCATYWHFMDALWIYLFLLLLLA